MLDQTWIFPLLGAVAGVLAGLLGVGGGAQRERRGQQDRGGR